MQAVRPEHAGVAQVVARAVGPPQGAGAVATVGAFVLVAHRGRQGVIDCGRRGVVSLGGKGGRHVEKKRIKITHGLFRVAMSSAAASGVFF